MTCLRSTAPPTTTVRPQPQPVAVRTLLLCSALRSLPFSFSICLLCLCAVAAPVTPRALRLPADGWLGTAISAHFCAAIPNYKVLEVDVDDV